jgi:hypothetical protein
MELILKSDNKTNLEKVIALAKKLHISVEQRDTRIEISDQKEFLKERILNFKAEKSSSFGNANDWQREQRNDRDLPIL